MENLKKQYNKYAVLCELIKEETSSKENFDSKFCNSEVGNFYFSLTDKQKEEYLKIHPNEDIKKYEKKINRIKNLEIQKEHLLEEALYVKGFPFNPNNKFSIFVMDGVDTYNVLTDESTEGKDIDVLLKLFIQDVIRKNYYVDYDYTKDDIPLIKVIVEDLKRKKPALNELEYTVSYKVSKVHDNEKKNITYKSTYLDIDKMKRDLIEEKEIIDNSDTRFKYLLEEQLLAASYELELLSGKSMRELYNEVTLIKEDALREDHLVALTKAYYNLSDINFRDGSNYFANKTDSMYAEFSTSIKEINEKILTMKKR